VYGRAEKWILLKGIAGGASTRVLDSDVAYSRSWPPSCIGFFLQWNEKCEESKANQRPQ
jgi:hypothetical protein